MFVENRLRHLLATGTVSAKVLAPQPWFFNARARFAESRHGIEVLHPSFLTIPKLGLWLNPEFLYRAAKQQLETVLASGEKFDLIDAHYFYPDGVAAVRLGKKFNLPVVITARGSDITQFPDFPYPRRQILAAAAACDAIITVSGGLKRAMTDLGVAPDKITVLRNGVDLSQFTPQDRAEARTKLNVEGKILLSVGALIARKGHDRTITALRDLPGFTLLIAGAGEERSRLEALAAQLGIANRVKFLGAVAHQDLAPLYSAADISVLASSREGWANVLLESLACGTPVVASPIPGNDEVIGAPVAGRLAAENTAPALAAAIMALDAAIPAREAVRAYAENFSWDAVSAGQLALFSAVLARRAKTRHHEPFNPHGVAAG